LIETPQSALAPVAAKVEIAGAAPQQRAPQIALPPNPPPPPPLGD
jgi:hypothetical protein